MEKETERNVNVCRTREGFWEFFVLFLERFRKSEMCQNKKSENRKQMFVKYSATGPLCPFRATGVSRPEAHLPQHSAKVMCLRAQMGPSRLPSWGTQVSGPG